MTAISPLPRGVEKMDIFGRTPRRDGSRESDRKTAHSAEGRR